MLHYLLRMLLDAPMADAIIGDLDEQCRRRSAAGSRVRGWRLATAGGIVANISARRLQEIAMDGLSARLGMRGVWPELMQASRSLIRTPVSSLVVVAMLALGLGLNTAIFSVVHGVLFDPLPFPEPGRVVVIEGRTGDAAPSRFGTSYLDFVDLRDHQRTFSEVATSTYWTFTVTGVEVPLRLVGARVSGDFFSMLNVPPALGRPILPADDEPGADEVAVLSHGLWQRVFGGDEGIVGQTLQMNGVTTRVVGVMPAGFRFPAEDMDLWVGRLDDELGSVPRTSRFFVTQGRLREGVTPEAAQQDLLAVTEGLAREFPSAYHEWQPVVTPALTELTAGARPRLLLIFTAVVVVLLVAGVNVTALIVSRGSSRSREFAVRAALGAGGWRLARVTVLESLWLGVAGLAGGLALAMPAVAWLRSLAPADLPRLDNISLSWPIVAWAALAMLFFVVVGGLTPFLRLRRTATTAIRDARIARSSRAWGRRALVMAQVAAAFALLVAAGLLVRSFSRVLAVEPGFNPANVARVQVFLTPPNYRTMESQIQYVTDALAVLESTPGVVSAAAVTQPPFDTEGGGSTLPVAVAGRTYQPGTHPSIAYRLASASYFSTMGIRLLGGRGFTDDDRENAPLVAVINETMARQLWPGEDPVGQRFEFADNRNAGTLTVVGVVNDVATSGLEQDERPAIYAPYRQRSLPHLRWTALLARTRGDVTRELASVVANLQALDPDQPLYGVTTMDQVIARSLAERRFSLTLMSAFAGLTLVLAVLGLYGALAQTVAQRLREIGVRLAIGAQPGAVFRLVVVDGLKVVIAGVGLGVGVAVLAASRVEALLFGVPALDAVTYLAMATLLSVVGLVACAVPAVRASRVDPIRVLRSE